LFRRALAIDEDSIGADHEEVATDLNNLGVHLFLQRRLPEAETCLARRLRILSRCPGTSPRLRRELQGAISVYGALLTKMGIPQDEIRGRVQELLAGGPTPAP
jgi:hypothetical protein